VTFSCKIAPLNYTCTYANFSGSDKIALAPKDLHKDFPSIYSWFVTQQNSLNTTKIIDSPNLLIFIEKNACAFGLVFTDKMLLAEIHLPEYLQGKKTVFFVGYVVNNFSYEVIQNIEESTFNMSFGKMIENCQDRKKRSSQQHFNYYTSEFSNLSYSSLSENLNHGVLNPQYRFINFGVNKLDPSSIHKENTLSKQHEFLADSNEFKGDSNIFPVSESLSKWAPIVYSRTFKDDYRFLAYPSDLNQDEIDWIRSHIQSTFRSAEKLRSSCRWSIFKISESICVVGLSCMGDDIADGEKVIDQNDRRVHLFVGYASRYPFSFLPKRDINDFKLLYKFVKSKWTSRSKSDITMGDYEYIFLEKKRL
jgi:hypothetical protein